MKRIFIILIISLVSIFTLSSCNNTSNNKSNEYDFIGELQNNSDNIEYFVFLEIYRSTNQVQYMSPDRFELDGDTIIFMGYEYNYKDNCLYTKRDDNWSTIYYVYLTTFYK